MRSLLYATTVPITKSISIRVPSVGEIWDDEENYFNVISSIIATPYDMMVQLDDQGIDFTKITDFDLFLLLFQRLQTMDTKLVFGDLNLSNFRVASNQISGEFVLRDDLSDIIIDKPAYTQICMTLRTILSIPRTDKVPGNEEARQYMIKLARRKQKRHSNQKRESQLEKYIVALVNTEQFPYNYSTVRDISIFQFYSSLNQIAHKIRFDNVMIGYYAGTVKGEDLRAGEKTWIKSGE